MQLRCRYLTEEDENRNLLMKEMFCSFDYHNTYMVYMTGRPYVKLFLSRLEKELFMFFSVKPPSYKLTREEWQAMRNRQLLLNLPIKACVL